MFAPLFFFFDFGAVVALNPALYIDPVYCRIPINPAQTHPHAGAMQSKVPTQELVIK